MEKKEDTSYNIYLEKSNTNVIIEDTIILSNDKNKKIDKTNIIYKKTVEHKMKKFSKKLNK